MIEITFNLEEVIGDLTKDMELIADAAKDGLYAGGSELMDSISEYPPTSEANESGPYPKKWYVRGIGSHWALKKGGFHFSKNSQQLNKRWAIEKQDKGSTVVIGNNATYAPFVHDKDHQAPFHGQRGWKTAQDVIDDGGRDIVIRNIRDFVKTALRKYNRGKS